MPLGESQSGTPGVLMSYEKVLGCRGEIVDSKEGKSSQFPVLLCAVLRLLVLLLGIISSALAVYTAAEIFCPKIVAWDVPLLIAGSKEIASLIYLVLLLIFFSAYVFLSRKAEVDYGYGMQGIINPVSKSRDETKCSDECTVRDINCLVFGDPSIRVRPDGSKVLDTTELALATVFLTACLTPKEIFPVIDERIKTDTHSLRVDTKLSIKVPYNFQGHSIVIPVLFCRRDDYPDALSIEGLSECDITSMNLQESIDYISEIVTCCLPELKSDENKQLKKGVLHFINSVQEISNPNSSGTKESRDKQLQAICTAFDGVTNKEDCYPNARERAEVVKCFLRLLLGSYPICIRIGVKESVNERLIQKWDSHCLRYLACRARTEVIRVTYRMPLARVKPYWSERGVMRFVAWFVRRPNTIYYGLNNADRTQSYHLQAAGFENSFCSTASLKYFKPEEVPGRCGERFCSTTNLKYFKPNITQTNKNLPRPEAEIALSQTRCGQRHFWLCAKNGEGFSNWALMYRHMPRSFNSYHAALIASSLTAAMLWVLFGVFFDDGNCLAPEGNNSQIIIGLITILATIAMAYISREVKSTRGADSGPFVVASIVIAAAILSLLYAAKDYLPSDVSNFVQVALVVCFALLVACSIALLVRTFLWWMILSRFRNETEASVNLTEPSAGNQKGDIKLSARLASGWAASNCMHPAPGKSNCAACKHLANEYKGNRCYVRNVFVPMAVKQAKEKKGGSPCMGRGVFFSSLFPD